MLRPVRWRRIEVVVARLEIADVVQRRAVQIGAAADEQRNLRGQRLQHVLARLAGGDLGRRRETRGWRPAAPPRRASAWPSPRGDCGPRPARWRAPSASLGFLAFQAVEDLGPGRVGGAQLLFTGREERAHLRRDEVRLRRQSQALARRLGELRPTLAVRLLRPLDLGDPLADERLGDDQLRLAAARPLGAHEGGEERLHLVAVHRLDVEPERLEPLGRVLALGLLGHRVQRDGVRIVDEDQVVELLVAREGERLHRHPLLHAAVARQADDVVIEDGVLGGVEAGLRHLGADRHADRVADPLAERAGRRLDAARRVGQLRVTGRLRAELPEALDLVERDVAVAAQVQPGVEEHRAVSGRQHEPIAVQPARAGRIVAERVTVEHGADLGAAERQPEVAALTRDNRVDRQTPRHGGRLGENRFGKLAHLGRQSSWSAPPSVARSWLQSNPGDPRSGERIKERGSPAVAAPSPLPSSLRLADLSPLRGAR